MTSQIKKLENLANIQNENLSKTEKKMNMIFIFKIFLTNR